MGFGNFLKQMLSTGQASMVDEAEKRYASGDLEGAVKCLEDGLQSRQANGKALNVMKERYDAYSEELQKKRINDHRATLADTPFNVGNFTQIEQVISTLDRGLKESRYRGQARTEAEILFKEYLNPFKDFKRRVQQEKQYRIISRLHTLSSEEDADTFVNLVEDLRRMGGRIPESLHGAFRTAEERSFILSENLREFAGFVIEQKLGNGGFASVYLASSKGIGGYHAAIKIFAPQPTVVRESGLSLRELKDRFKREASIMMRLSEERTPGIVRARHSDLYNGKPYLLMNYYPKSLCDLIGSDDALIEKGQGQSISYQEALPIINTILKSINTLHTRPSPIIHRDLKPANILLDQANRPYIGDFGLAREVSRMDLLSSAFQTATGANLASRYYGAPEQQGGFKEADHRADIYSLGVLIYRILTGRLIGYHDLEPLAYNVNDLNEEMANRLDELIQKAIRLEPNQRLSSVASFVNFFGTEQTPIQLTDAGPSPNEQFRTVLETAYALAPGEELPESAHNFLEAKARELGVNYEEAKALEKDFRSRMGLGKTGLERVVSVTWEAASGTVSEKGTGSLYITSEPEMAVVFVDGIERGKTPISLSRVNAGKRTIRLKLENYFPVSRIELIHPNQEATIHVILEPQRGSIKVAAETFSASYGARFYLDGSLIGKVPLVVEDVSAGVHAWRMEAEGHKHEGGEVTVALDEQTMVSRKLEPLPGRVTIKTFPSGATVWLNGKDTGKKTDGTWELKPGNYHLLLKLSGYIDVKEKLKLLPGGAAQKSAALVKDAARLSVNSVPDGAAIWLDDNDTGRLTDTVIKVTTGKHKIILLRDGYDEVNEELELSPEQFLEVNFRLKKEEAATDQVEKDGQQDRYEELANNIVKDHQTGLEWIAGPDKDTDWNEAKKWVESLEVDGGGWRMPTLDELEGLYDEGRGVRNMTPLLQTSGWVVWSGARDSSNAWCVAFDSGFGRYPSPEAKVNLTRAFAVRGKSKFKGHYEALANNIVKDHQTGLDWIAGPDKDTDWNEAKKWVESLEVDGGGWRMPTIEELEDLWVEAEEKRNMTLLLRTTGWFVWSGAMKGSSNAWYFDIYDGKRGWHDRSDSNKDNRAFAVRRSRGDG